jgi:hypothetical protein
MTIDLTQLFVDWLADNRGPDPNDCERRQIPNYGVTAALSGASLEVELTFRSGSAFCCFEFGCHVAIVCRKRWVSLRRRMAAHGITAPPQMMLHAVCIIEDGALCFDFGLPDLTRRGWYAFAPQPARRYILELSEAPASD